MAVFDGHYEATLPSLAVQLGHNLAIEGVLEGGER
jgi:hypothetical protein